jgi:nitrogen regulatory protein PII
MYMITLVLHNPDLLEEVLAAWRAAGIHRATVLFSMGIGQAHQKGGLRDDIPLIPSMEDFYEIPESFGRTIFAVVRGEDIIKQVLEATQNVVGDLEQPKTGILLVTPVTQAYGLEKSQRAK